MGSFGHHTLRFWTVPHFPGLPDKRSGSQVAPVMLLKRSASPRPFLINGGKDYRLFEHEFQLRLGWHTKFIIAIRYS